MIDAPAAKPKLYCNQLAIEKGVDPIGHAGTFTTTMVIEIPLPWKTNMYDEAGVLPQQVLDLYEVRSERYRAGLGYPHSLLMVASDPNYSLRGYRRIMYYDRPSSDTASYRKVEYSVPEAEFGDAIWALTEAREQLPQYEQYRDPANDATREILVCTHGSVDVACAKFGYPLYNYMRKNLSSDDLRVWRVSHFGGHLFAPTLIDMPVGHYWAYVEREQADQIVNRTGNPRDLYKHYRGWSGLSSNFLQAAERELWMQYGWDWFSMSKSGTVISEAEGEEPDRATVQVDYTFQGQSLTYKADVEVHQRISTPYSTGSAETYAYPQYVVKQLQTT